MYRLPCAELCSCQSLFINHVSDCQKLFCLQVYFRANSYRYLRIEFQKEDKLTHRRYAPSFERITQWVDKVGQYISVINLRSRYLHGPMQCGPKDEDDRAGNQDGQSLGGRKS
jgi:hypothetical protein